MKAEVTEVALLTQHGKERVIAPLFDTALGYQVAHVSGYDTDSLGTFTRDIARHGTQLEAARKKARVGMELAQLPLGLASEGSFGSDPIAGLFPWNTELVIFIDDRIGIEVVGVAQGKAMSGHARTTKREDAISFANSVGFPEHHLVIRPDDENSPHLQKGISHWEQFLAAFQQAQDVSQDGNVFIESDLRANANPTRMQMIERACKELIDKLQSLCPVCKTPGYWIVERIPGLPCAACGAPTRLIKVDVYGCLACNQRESRERKKPALADPGSCDICNP
jgi:hypothetical protein